MKADSPRSDKQVKEEVGCFETEAISEVTQHRCTETEADHRDTCLDVEGPGSAFLPVRNDSTSAEDVTA